MASNRLLGICFILTVSVCGFFFADRTPSRFWNESTPLSLVLIELGDSVTTLYSEQPKENDSNLIRQGFEIVHNGFALNNRGESSVQVSQYFVCTDCHNDAVEDPDLRFSDPTTRLQFAAEKNIPFLQGTTLKGVVNRESWYNGDYAEKYGERAVEAHYDLRKAIQLCAQECSQGRQLEEWELKGILAYLQSIEYQLGDLHLSDTTWNRLRSIGKESSPAERTSLIAELKSYYSQASPATFLPPPNDLQTGYGLVGDRQRGQAIYQLSCLHCHNPGGVTRFELDDDTLSLKRLKGKILRNRPSGFYQVIRDGTSPKSDHPQYMPRYSAQRMSDQQIEDLRAYVQASAN